MFLAISLGFIFSIGWSHAQTGFLTSFGGDGVQDGIGAVATAEGFLVVSRSLQGAFGRPGILLFMRTENGQALSEIDLPLDGVVFPQAVAAEQSGGCFIAGSIITPGAHESDGLLIHLGADGTLLWTSIAPVADDELYLSVSGTPDGGALVSGVVGKADGHDGLLARFNGTGTLLWSVTTGSPLDDELMRTTATIDAVMATGRLMNPGGTSDLLIIKADLGTAVPLWTNLVGGPSNDMGHAVVSNTDGTCFGAGTTFSYGPVSTSGASLENIFLVAFDQAGDTLWTSAHGDPVHNRSMVRMARTPNGDLLIAGTHYLTGTSDAMVLRFNTSGEQVWERVFDLGIQEQLKGITALPDGFVTTRRSFQDIGRQVLLLRRDANGF